MSARNLSSAALVILAAILLPICLTSNNAEAQGTTLEIEITISPKTLSLGSVSGSSTGVTVHADIPLSEVDTATLELEGLPLVYAKSDNHGDLVAKFDRDDVCAIVAPPSATLTLTGAKLDGTPIAGTDTISVVE
jgi:hypothetical protein